MLYLLLKDEEVNTFLPWFPVKNMEETRAFYEKRLKNQEYYFAISTSISLSSNFLSTRRSVSSLMSIAFSLKSKVFIYFTASLVLHLDTPFWNAFPHRIKYINTVNSHAFTEGYEMMEYRVDDRELSASIFIPFVNRIWPGRYDAAKTQIALSKTRNISAYDDVLVGCLRILSDGYYLEQLRNCLSFRNTGGRE